jgi:hypothetical protein
MKKCSNIKKFGRGYVRYLLLAAGVFLGLVVVVPRSPGYGGGGCSGGPAWSYAAGTPSRCSVPMPITVTCLAPSATGKYADYETPGSATSCDGSTIGLTAYPGNNKDTDANGTLVINDVLNMGCPPDTAICTDTIAKTWHIYDRVTGGYLNDVTSSPDTVTAVYTATTTTLSDSQLTGSWTW